MGGFAIDRSRKLTWKLFKEQPSVGIDLEPVDWDPMPGLSNAIDKGGWPEGLKHLRGKIRKLR